MSYKLRNLLSVYAQEVLCTDPYVSDPTLVPLEEAIERADVIVLGAPHTIYRNVVIPEGKKVIDIWHFWDRANVGQSEVAEAAARAGA